MRHLRQLCVHQFLPIQSGGFPAGSLRFRPSTVHRPAAWGHFPSLRTGSPAPSFGFCKSLAAVLGEQVDRDSGGGTSLPRSRLVSNLRCRVAVSETLPGTDGTRNMTSITIAGSCLGGTESVAGASNIGEGKSSGPFEPGPNPEGIWPEGLHRVSMLVRSYRTGEANVR